MLIILYFLASAHISFVRKKVNLFGAFKQYVSVCADDFRAVSKNCTLLSFLLLTYTDIITASSSRDIPPFGGMIIILLAPNFLNSFFVLRNAFT